MPISPESLYRQLGQLVAELPSNLAGPGDLPPDIHRLLGRANSILGELTAYFGASSVNGRLNMMDQLSFRTASEGLHGFLRETHAHQIIAILHRALALAEINAPAAVQGAFIPVGAAFDTFQIIGKLLSSATKDVYITDAYMGIKVITDFALLTPENVIIRLLTDSFYTKPTTLQAAATHWSKQYGSTRPLDIRFTAPRLLHDRLIIIDGAHVWSLTQSLKDMANRSPASVLRVESDVAKLKIEAYEQFWANATAL